MPDLRISIGVEGDTQLLRSFKNIEDGVADTQPILVAGGEQVYEEVRLQFHSGGAAGASGAWKELAPATEEAKYKKGQHFSGILRATDALYKDVTTHGAGVYRLEKDSLTVGSLLKYAKLHQTGTNRMAARRIYDLSEAQKKRIIKRMQRPLVDLARRQTFIQTEIGEVG